MTGNVIRGTADHRLEARDLEGIGSLPASRETDAPSSARPLLIRHRPTDSSWNPTMQRPPCSSAGLRVRPRCGAFDHQQAARGYSRMGRSTRTVV